METSFGMSSQFSDESGKKFLYLKGPFLEAERRNRNGRIYPYDEIRRVVMEMGQKISEGGPIGGELDHPCFWNRTEALTRDGWKSIKDVRIGELVYSLNLDTGHVELKPNVQTQVHPYRGKLYKFKGRQIETAVTPNHKMVLRDRDGKLSLMTAREIYQRYSDNEPGIKKMQIVKRSSGIENVNDSRTISFGSVEMAMEDYAAFMGIYLSEGHTSKRPNGGFRIGISQNEGEVADQIRDLLKRIDLYWPEQKTNMVSGNVKIQFECIERENLELAEHLYELGKSHEKAIPSLLMDVLDERLASIFLDWFIMGDGRNTRDQKYEYCDAFTTSSRLIEGLCQAATIAGLAYRCYTIDEFEDVIIENRVIKAANKRPIHFIKFLHSQGVYIDNRFLKIEEIDWDANVYCLTVQDNSTFFVRDGEQTFWTGNSGLNMNFDRLSHAITEIRMDGNFGVGVIKVADNPHGHQIRSAVELGIRVGVSSRGAGSVDDDGRVSDYSMVTIDAVLQPSANAYPTPVVEAFDLDPHGREFTRLAGFIRDDQRAQVYMEEELKRFITNIRDKVKWGNR